MKLLQLFFIPKLLGNGEDGDNPQIVRIRCTFYIVQNTFTYFYTYFTTLLYTFCTYIEVNDCLLGGPWHFPYMRSILLNVT